MMRSKSNFDKSSVYGMEPVEVKEVLQRVINCLIHLKNPDSKMQKDNLKMGRNGGIIAQDFGIEEWDWPQGVGLYGMLQYRKHFQNDEYDEFLKEWFAGNMKKGLPSSNINTTAPFLALVSCEKQMKQPELEMECIKRAKWLMEKLPRTEDRIFQHVTSAIGDRYGVRLNEDQVWIDTIFMAVLFLNKMGIRYEQKDWMAESAYQIKKHIEYLWDAGTGLFYHGYSFERKDHFGGIFWCRGNSWYTNGIMDYLEDCGERIDPVEHRQFVYVYRKQVKTLKQLQSETGLWHTVLDDKSSYEEVSGSAAIIAGILKGIRLEILDRKEYYDCVSRGLRAICGNVQQDGVVAGVSAGTGIGMSAEDYKNIVIAPMAYGQSLTIIALSELLNNVKE